jgi:hypothetical protein
VQPYIAFGAGLLALTLYRLLGQFIESRPLRAVAACIAAQPALLYGYALWGGVKEVPAAAMVPLVVALTPLALQSDPSSKPAATRDARPHSWRSSTSAAAFG